MRYLGRRLRLFLPHLLVQGADGLARAARHCRGLGRDNRHLDGGNLVAAALSTGLGGGGDCDLGCSGSTGLDHDLRSRAVLRSGAYRPAEPLHLYPHRLRGIAVVNPVGHLRQLLRPL